MVFGKNGPQANADTAQNRLLNASFTNDLLGVAETKPADGATLARRKARVPHEPRRIGRRDGNACIKPRERVASRKHGITPTDGDGDDGERIVVSPVEEVNLDQAGLCLARLDDKVRARRFAVHDGGECGPAPVEFLVVGREAVPEDAREIGRGRGVEFAHERGERNRVGTETARVCICWESDAKRFAEARRLRDGAAGGIGVAEGAGIGVHRVDLKNKSVGDGNQAAEFGFVSEPTGQCRDGERSGGNGVAQRDQPATIIIQFGFRGIEINLKFGRRKALRAGVGEEIGGQRDGNDAGSIGAKGQADVARERVVTGCDNDGARSIHFGIEDNEAVEHGGGVGDGAEESVVPVTLPNVSLLGKSGRQEGDSEEWIHGGKIP